MFVCFRNKKNGHKEVEQFAREKPAVSEQDLKKIESNLINLKFITMLSNDNLPKHLMLIILKNEENA